MLSFEFTKKEAALVMAGLEKVLAAKGTPKADKDIVRSLNERYAADAEVAYRVRKPRLTAGEVEAAEVADDE